MSPCFEGVDPPLEWPGGKGDDYPRLFTLNYAEILGFKPAHDPNHDYIRKTGARSPDPLHAFSGPKVLPKFEGLDLIQAG